MCGIAGAWRLAADRPAEELEGLVGAMTLALRHRGPDDEGFWVDAGAGVALGHRRLSVIDLSAAGHQPMASASGRYLLTYNGELYNFQELLAQLSALGVRFRGHSDTEVLLAAFDRWGLKATLDRCNGMFAFGLWDTRERALHLVRDRMGEKPMYYGWVDGTLLFGSELGALRAHRRFRSAAEVDRDVLSLYLRLNYVPAPHSIYTGVAKLAAGTVLTVRAGDRPGGARPWSYWPFTDVVAGAIASRRSVSDPEATEELDRLLREAVRLRMHSDVPLGAFLSGGVDSSAVVALMQDQAQRPVRTFTVGFADPRLDESAAARAVARHLGTDHTEVELSPGAALDIVPRLPGIYDEPFADPSQLPTVAIAEVARRHVTVCLSGDGGDEAFGGYNRYTVGQRLWSRLRHVPRPVRSAAARGLLGVPPRVADRFLPAAKAQKLAAVLGVGSPADVYRALVSSWDDPDALVVGGHEPPWGPATAELPAGLDDVAEQMMFLDSVSTLPDEMLAKLDRASMTVALETRVPLLDHRVVEHSWGLPVGMRIKDRQGKWLLRQVLHRYVPRHLLEGPKRGFDPPVAEWLRGPLRPWAEELLGRSRLEREGFLQADVVTRCWSEHLAGARDWDYRLWGVLMFQSWLENQREVVTSPPRRSGDG